MKKTILMGLMLSAIASIVMAAAGTMMSVAYADKFTPNDPNNSERSQQNANDRLQKKIEKVIETMGDDKIENDHGPNEAMENQVNGKGNN